MPPGRSVRQRAVTNENDEANTTRLTRAKAAALATDGTSASQSTTAVAAATAGSKKPLQSKSSTNNNNNNTLQRPAAPLNRKRAALGDVSNVAKSEVVEAKEMKKAAGTAKSGLVSKASQVAGVHKPGRAVSSRSVLPAKAPTNRKPTSAELKRPASGSGVMGGLPKKRQTTSTASHQSIKEEESIKEEKSSREQDVEPAKTKAFTVEVERRDQVELSVEEAPRSPAYEDEVDLKEEPAEMVRDLDNEDLDDPLMVADYVVEIFDYLRELEQKTMPNADYMEHQDELEWKMRGILVDWLIEVHARFHLLPETLFLTVNIIDRFLSMKVVQLDRLQLVGVAAMFIASKYEEVLSPHVSSFRHVADDGFTEQEILSAERFILQTLNYDLSYPNPMNFLRRISKADNYDIQTRTLAKYLLEISLLDDRLMRYCSSHVAASAMYLSRLILDRGDWDATMAHYSGYTEEEIDPVFRLMVDYLARPVAHEAFFKKYASKKFLKASILTRQWAKRYCAVEATTSTRAAQTIYKPRPTTAAVSR
ncbi:MAG: G2/mitotic-specific cyclin [Lichina confinis]|nr:MAG: G2/mitotic-specific cyclin [Lichina confinis]